MSGQPVAPPRSARRQFASTILVLEAMVIGFAGLAAYGLRAAPTGMLWAVFGSLLLALVLLAGMLRLPAAYWAGSTLQAGVLLTALVVPMMAVVGVIFVVLWVTALRLGGRIDRERAERAAGSTGEPR